MKSEPSDAAPASLFRFPDNLLTSFVGVDGTIPIVRTSRPATSIRLRNFQEGNLHAKRFPVSPGRPGIFHAVLLASSSETGG